MPNRTDPDPSELPSSMRLGYGLLAAVPLVLLLLSGLVAVSASLGVAAQLLYVHVAAQFIVLLMYGDLLMKSKAIDTTGRVLWGAYFLMLAPVAVLSFWYLHVWSKAAGPRRGRTIQML